MNSADIEIQEHLYLTRLGGRLPFLFEKSDMLYELGTNEEIELQTFLQTVVPTLTHACVAQHANANRKGRSQALRQVYSMKGRVLVPVKISQTECTRRCIATQYCEFALDERT